MEAFFKKNIEDNLLMKLMDSSADAIQISDVSGRLVYINEQAANRLGIEKSEVSNYHVADFESRFISRGSDEWKNHVEELKKKGNMIIEGININQKHGKKIPVEVTVSYCQIKENEYVIALSKDISDRVKLNQEILSQQKAISAIYETFQKIISREEYQTTIDEGFDSVSDFLNIDSVNIYLLEKDEDKFVSRHTYLNSKRVKKSDTQINNHTVYSSEFNYLRDQMINGKPLLVVGGCPFIPEKKKTIIQRKIICYFVPLVDKNILKGFIKVDEYRDEDGTFENRIEKYYSYTRIINTSYSLLNHRIELLRNNKKFKHLYSSINDIFFLYDVIKDGYKFISPSCEKEFGLSQQQFYDDHRNMENIIVPEDRGLFKANVNELRKKESVSYEYRIKLKDGTIKYIQKNMYAIMEGRFLSQVSGVCIDISEKKKNETIIKKSMKLISDQNQSLIEKNEKFKNLLLQQESDLYLKTVKMANRMGFLLKSKKELEKVFLESKGSYSVQIKRAIEYINKAENEGNSEWQEIRAEFEKIRPDFFKNISSSFNNLSPNDLKHCYYIVTGLNNLEVANILNISIRSVETARYRIKKKFGLHKKDSLFHFINQF